MFTGIIEALGKVEKTEKNQSNLDIYITCPFTNELKIDQSLAHNGVCLTVVDIMDNTYKVTAIDETLQKSNIGLLKSGEEVNLERAMPMNGRLDGHIVQGHVDTTATCINIEPQQGSWLFSFKLNSPQIGLMVDKGSITVNGTSLTLIKPTEQTFSVAVIPYTFEHTNFKHLKTGSIVNIEFDILGKYVSRHLENYTIKK